MILRKFGLAHRNQTGFAMIEIMVGVAVMGFIGAGLVMTTFQTLNVNDRNSAHMMAIKQVQNAGYWISHDAQMGQTIDLDDDPGTPENEVLILSWVGWERKDASDNQYIDTITVRYTQDSNELARRLKITTEKYGANGNLIATTEEQKIAIVARHITGLSVAMGANSKLTITITASVDNAQEEKSYEITPRPSA